MRELRDSEDASGFSRALWKEMAEMGWPGILLPEEFGGAGMGYGELGVVLEECGRVLAPEPFVSTVLLGGTAILLGGSDPVKKDLRSGRPCTTTARPCTGRPLSRAPGPSARRTAMGSELWTTSARRRCSRRT